MLKEGKSPSLSNTMYSSLHFLIAMVLLFYCFYSAFTMFKGVQGFNTSFKCCVLIMIHTRSHKKKIGHFLNRGVVWDKHKLFMDICLGGFEGLFQNSSFCRKNYETISKYFLTISKNFLSLSQSILLYLYFGLSWSIFGHLGLSWSISIYLSLSWSISVYLRISGNISKYLGLSGAI